MPLTAAETPLFDPIAIDKLRRIAGDQGTTFVAEMAQLFLEETTRVLAELQSGCERDDWMAVSRIAHSVKSSAATLGLMRLSAACKALELDTRNATSSPETENHVADVMDQFKQAIPILKRLF
jgi:HPt (histidine-containing phosphotransfer) domain-containing protein